MTDRLRHLIVAPAWPPHRPPTWIASELTARGDSVVVGAPGPVPSLAPPLAWRRVPAMSHHPAGAATRLVLAGARALRHPGDAVMVARPHRTHRRRRLVEVAQTLAVVGDDADLIWVAATTEAQAFLPLAATGRLAVAVDDRPAPAAAPLLGAACRVLAATPDLAARAAALAPRGDVEIATPSPVDGNLEVPAQPRRLALVAPWDWESGIDDALRAVAALRRSGRDTRLDLAGCGPAEEQIRYTVRDLGLSEAVRLRGPAAAERIVAGADAAVLPALTDRPWPEAVAVARSGRPLIVTDLPWLRRAVPVATFIPPRDPEALTDALDQRADDPPNP